MGKPASRRRKPMLAPAGCLGRPAHLAVRRAGRLRSLRVPAPLDAAQARARPRGCSSGSDARPTPDVRPLKRNIAWRAADRVAGTSLDSFDLQYVFYPSSFGVAVDPWFRDADVVQLYNTHGCYFSHTALPFLSRLRPVVWRLSDMWAITGHVAYSYDCERWRHGCGIVPVPRRVPRALARHDRRALALEERRLQALEADDRRAVALDRAARVREPAARALPDRAHPERDRPRRFRRVPREEARARLGLPQEGPVVLFSAPDVSDRRKGGALLNAALERLNGLPFRLLVAGANETPPFPRSFWSLTHLVDEAEIALSYAAADVFVLPTLAENLPNAALESIASGTPCVSFDVGGVPDVVRHMETGLPREARRRRRARGGDPNAARRRRSCATGWARPAARSPRPSSAPSSRRSGSPTCTTTSQQPPDVRDRRRRRQLGRRAARAARRVAPPSRARRRRRRDRGRRRARGAPPRDPRPRDRRAADDLAERSLDDRLQRRDLQRPGAARAARARRARASRPTTPTPRSSSRSGRSTARRGCAC